MAKVAKQTKKCCTEAKGTTWHHMAPQFAVLQARFWPLPRNTTSKFKLSHPHPLTDLIIRDRISPLLDNSGCRERH